MGMIKDFFYYPDRNPRASVIQIITWMTIFLAALVAVFCLAVWFLISAPYWLWVVTLGGWISFSFYYYWYYEIAKVNSQDNRYKR